VGAGIAPGNHNAQLDQVRGKKVAVTVAGGKEKAAQLATSSA
jgi:hypothetical protein